MIKINKWVYTTDEMIEFISNHEFDNYTIFIKSQLVERHDHIFVCGTWTINNKYYTDIIRFISIYGDCKYLLTELDIEKEHIVFNLIKEGESDDSN